MNMRASFTISGNAQGAVAALNEASAAVARLEQLRGAGALTDRQAAVAAMDLAQAQRIAAGALADVRAQFNPTYAIARNYKAAIDGARTAHQLGAISARELADAIARERREAGAAVAAIRAHNGALGAMSRANNGARIGFQQLGFQAGDFFTQLSMGGNPMIAFTVQAQQAVGVIQMMHASGGLATGALSRMATVLAGPVGIGLGVVLPLVGMLATKLFETRNAAQAAEIGATGLAEAQNVLGGIFDLTTGRIRSQNEMLLLNARLTALNLRAEALRDQASSGKALGRTDTLNGALGWWRTGLGAIGVPVGGADNALSVRDLAQQFRRGDLSSDAALRRSANIDFSGLAISREEFQQAIINSVSAPLRAQMADRIEASINSQRLDPSIRRAATDQGERRERGGGGAARAARANAADAAYADRAEDAVARINENWAAQPSLIVRANAAARDLDNVIAAAQQRLARGGIGAAEAGALRERIAEAEGALETVAAGLGQPFAQLQEAHERQIEQLSLIRAGREDEAAALTQIYQLQGQVGDVTRDQRQAILDNVAAERLANEAVARRKELIDTYSQSIGDMRGNLEGLLSGEGGGNFFGNLRRNFQQVQGRILTEQIFGPALRGLDEYVRQETSIQSSVDIMTAGTRNAGTAAQGLAASLVRAQARIDGGGGTGGILAAGIGAGPGAANVAGAGLAGAGAAGGVLADIAASVAGAAAATAAGVAATGAIAASAENRDIVVQGGVMALSPNDFFKRAVDDLVDPALRAFDDLLGTNFFIGLRGVLSGGIQGYMTAGPVGAALGALGGIKGLPEGISKGLARALGGAQTGTQIAGIGKALGIKTSSTGGAIGGAIGGATGIPGMQIVGGILGSVVGGLLKKTPYGTATLSGSGDAAVAGNKKGARDGARSMAGAVQDGLAGIAEQLGGEVGSYLVSIGTYKGKARVSGSGKKGKLKGGDVQDFGTDGADAAVAAAIQDAIADGGIKYISDAVQRALKSTTNVDKALKEALKVQEVELALGGIGALAAKEFRAAEAQARERLRIARQYGFDVLAIEKYNADARRALTEKLLDEQVGSLQRLVDQMTSGSLFEGSAMDRRGVLLDKIALAKGDLDAGKAGAGDRLADLYEQLNSLSKEIYGTTGGFANDRSAIIDAATAAIAKANADIGKAAGGSDPALATTNAALDENNDQNAQMIAQLGDIGISLEQMLAAGSAGDGRLIQDRLASRAATATP